MHSVRLRMNEKNVSHCEYELDAPHVQRVPQQFTFW